MAGHLITLPCRALCAHQVYALCIRELELWGAYSEAPPYRIALPPAVTERLEASAASRREDERIRRMKRDLVLRPRQWNPLAAHRCMVSAARVVLMTVRGSE